MAVIMVEVAEEGGEVKLSRGGTRLEYVPEHRRCLGPGAGERNCDCDDLCGWRGTVRRRVKLKRDLSSYNKELMNNQLRAS